MTVRKDVMHLIDPIEAFNAYNLSMACGPVQDEQDEWDEDDETDRNNNFP